MVQQHTVTIAFLWCLFAYWFWNLLKPNVLSL
jgi:hypothetical protein